MPQKLQVKVTTPTGEEALREVTILRTFCHASGAMVFQHTNGVYGYKDGAPVRTREELEIISHPLHRKAALLWWERRGQKMSEEYQAAQQERERARIGDFQAADKVDNTELDGKLYYRQALADSEDAPLEGPFTWMELFPNRPDWWGQASAIQFLDYQYMLEDTMPLGAVPDPSDPTRPTPPPVPPEVAEAEAIRKAEAAEEAARQQLMAEIKARFPEATIHPATGMKKLQEKYLELQEEAEAKKAAGNTNSDADELE